MSTSRENVSVPSSSNEHVEKLYPTIKTSTKPKLPVAGREPGLPHQEPSTMLFEQCKEVLNILMSHKHAWIFNTPVDPNIPDYFTIIKYPMDLGTIKANLDSDSYTSPWEFAADVRLTFTNAKTYNPPRNQVHKLADTMSKIFEAKWKPIEEKLTETEATARRGKWEVPVKTTMTAAERESLLECLDSLKEDVPDNILDFVMRHEEKGKQTDQGEIEIDKIEIDINYFSDDEWFELQKLLEDHFRDKRVRRMAEADVRKVEVLNTSGLNNSKMSPCKGNKSADEGVGIGGHSPDGGPSQSNQSFVQTKIPRRKRSGPKRKPRSKEEDQIQSTNVAEADVCGVEESNASGLNNSRMSTCNQSADEGVGMGGNNPDEGPSQSKQNFGETKFPRKKRSDLKKEAQSRRRQDLKH